MEIDYYSKYLKYKNKYIQLKEQMGGANFNFTDCKHGNLKITLGKKKEFIISGTYLLENNNNDAIIKYKDIINDDIKEKIINFRFSQAQDKTNYSFDRSCNKNIKNKLQKKNKS